MATLILDPELQRRLLEARVASGADRFDEVWEGTYMMAPMPNDEHQQLVSRLVTIFQTTLGWTGEAEVRPGVNVSDRTDWRANYRVPDVAVFLKDGQAENRGAFWLGGPDFVVEIISPEDRTRDKLPFYEAVAVRELLLIDRAPWRLEWYQLQNGQLVLQMALDDRQESVIRSDVVPFSFGLCSGEDRPHIEVTHTTTGQLWRV